MAKAKKAKASKAAKPAGKVRAKAKPTPVKKAAKKAVKPAAQGKAKSPIKAVAKAIMEKVAKVAAPEKPVAAKKGRGSKASPSVVEDVAVDTKDLSPAAVLGTAIADAEVVLTDAEGRRYCRSNECDQIAAVDGYCRYHYLLYWKKIQVRKKILSDGKLERYIEELTARYTDKFIELLRKDLRTEKDFMAAIQELELDGGSDAPDEDEAKSYIEEFGGVGGAEPSREDDY